MKTPRRARVKVAYATVKIMDPVSGKPTVAGFYQGAVFPPDADPENVATLVRRDYAEWLDSDDLQAVVKQEDDAQEAQQKAVEQRAQDAEAAVTEAEEEAPEPVVAEEPGDSVGEPVQPLRRPTESASKDAWIEYAVAMRGEDVQEADARADAKAMTKVELIAAYPAESE